MMIGLGRSVPEEENEEDDEDDRDEKFEEVEERCAGRGRHGASSVLGFLDGEFFGLGDHFVFAREEFADEFAEDFLEFIGGELRHFFEGVDARLVEAFFDDGSDAADGFEVVFAGFAEGTGFGELGAFVFLGGFGGFELVFE